MKLLVLEQVEAELTRQRTYPYYQFVDVSHETSDKFTRMMDTLEVGEKYGLRR